MLTNDQQFELNLIELHTFNLLNKVESTLTVLPYTKKEDDIKSLIEILNQLKAINKETQDFISTHS